MTTQDLSSPRDLTVAADLTTPPTRDLASPPDLTVVVQMDLSMEERDLSTDQTDLLPEADLLPEPAVDGGTVDASGCEIDDDCAAFPVGQCEVPHCNTGTHQCEAQAKADNTPCNDGSLCTTGDSCQSGACQPGTPKTCSASDQCHVAGVCNPSTGVCSNPEAPDNTGCDDADPCTTGDSCQAGSCTGTPKTCAPSDQCHDAGVCNPLSGVCSNPVAQNGTSCDDGNGCTVDDACESGICQPGSAKTCAASDQCHVAGVCNPSTGQCSNPVADNDTPCNDGNLCTTGETCQAGSCTGGSAKTCGAGDQCHGPGVCNPSTGDCANPPLPNDTLCDDGNPCTMNDSCQSGSCTPGAPKTCVASGLCHLAGTCDPGTGFCSDPVADNDTPCNDGNACTQGETCQSGSCTPTTTTTCTPLDSCHDVGACDPGTGLCSNPQMPDNSPCNDDNACTQVDRCQSGACVGTSPIVCPAADECHGNSVCDPMNGVCSDSTHPDNTPCNGTACTMDDTCQSGICQGGTAAPAGTSCDATGGICTAGGTCVPSTLTVVRIGDGGAALGTGATAGFLEKRDLNGTLKGTIALPTAVSGSNRILTFSGTAGNEGNLSRSADGKYLFVGGYGATLGTASINGTAPATVNRIIGRIDANGVVDTTTRIDSAFSSGFRAVTSSDGLSIWATGANSGVQYTTLGALGSTTLTSSPTNIRTVHVIGSQVYATSGSSGFTNVFTVGSGLPTSGTQTATPFTGMPTTNANPNSFALFDRNPNVAGFDTLYVADERATSSGGGLQKWTFNGTTWTLVATFSNGSTTGFRGLAAIVTGNNVTVFVTTTETNANKIIAYVDTGVGSPTGTVIATAASNTVYRGIALSPF